MKYIAIYINRKIIRTFSFVEHTLEVISYNQDFQTFRRSYVTCREKQTADMTHWYDDSGLARHDDI